MVFSPSSPKEEAISFEDEVSEDAKETRRGHKSRSALNDLDSSETSKDSLYQSVSRLPRKEGLRYLCHAIQHLRDHSSLTQQGNQESIHATTTASTIYPGSSFFTKYQSYRYLCWNTSGFLCHIKKHQKKKNNRVNNKISKDVIEVVSNVAGVGQRRQTIHNATKNINLGAIGPDGFVLARGCVAWPFLKIPLSSQNNMDPVEVSSLSDEQHSTDSESLEPPSLNPQDMEEPSLLEYHPFSTWGVISKAWWSKTFTLPEHITHVAVGSCFVAALTTNSYLRVFTCSGLPIHTSYINGSPVALVGQNQFLLVVSLNVTRHHTKSYRVRFLQLPCFTEHLCKDFNSPSPRQIVWAGISSLLYPTLVNDMGCVFALLPGHPSSVAASPQVEWIPVLDLKHALSPLQAHELMSDPDSLGLSILHYVWIGSIQHQSLSIFPTSLRHPQPTLKPFKLRSLPFRLSMALDSLSTHLEYEEWMEYLESDPEFKDLTKVANLSWEFFDEIRCRAMIMIAQIEWILKYNLLDDQQTSQLKNMVQKEIIKSDKAAFRIFIKAFGEGKMERCLDVAKKVYHTKTFQIALNHAEARGNKALCEKLRAEMENRTIKENATVARNQLRVLHSSNSLQDYSSLHQNQPHKRSHSTNTESITNQLLRSAKLIE